MVLSDFDQILCEKSGLLHDHINMEFAEACVQAMYWHRGMGGGVS
jgi:hypothetical protein